MASSSVARLLSKALPRSVSVAVRSPSVAAPRVPPLASSTPPRRGVLTQPLAVECDERPTKRTLAPDHLEAMHIWRREAVALTDKMVTDDIPPTGNHPAQVNKVTEGQVKSLFEELIDEDLLDPRLSWAPTVFE